MDLTGNETIRATTIELGVPNDRELVGLMYFMPYGRTAHRSLVCPTAGYDVALVEKFPVYVEDGEWYRPLQGVQVVPVIECKTCPPTLNTEWQEWASCKGDDRGFSESLVERRAFIEERCNNCAVQLECLEYGEAGGNANSGAVWGGVYFNASSTVRSKKVDEQRDKIKSGVIG